MPAIPVVPAVSVVPAISVVPANLATFEDLQSIFGSRGAGSRCQCQRYKLQPGERFAGFPVEVSPS